MDDSRDSRGLERGQKTAKMRLQRTWVSRSQRDLLWESGLSRWTGECVDRDG